jgi:hypothetical protein
VTSELVTTNLQPSAYRLSTWSYDLADNCTNATHNGAATAYTLGIGDRLASTADGATYLYNAVGCVINLRLKGPGIFWHEDTADAMLMIRSYYKAQRWNELAQLACAAPLEALQ